MKTQITTNTAVFAIDIYSKNIYIEHNSYFMNLEIYLRIKV